MVLKLHNTLTKKIEDFKPLRDDFVGLYTCGPTVYNFPHIGNYRAYISSDILKRVLCMDGYTLRHIMNLTDIDDKTIRDSQAQKKSLKEFTEFYTEEFYKDRDSLGIIPATTYTKATDYVKEMLEIVEGLIEKGFAYITPDGSAYFKISSDKDYGKLSHLKLDELSQNASGRIKKDEYDKDNVQDFALWKAWDEADGEVFWIPTDILGWKTELTKGRPGWHIECSAMSIATLGNHFDIHTGGIDNMFPHHENEIAQSESFTSETFVNYWLHNEWLLVDGKKMAKSAGNFYTLRDVIEKGIDPMAFRYFCFLTHYRTPINFSWEALSAAQAALRSIQTFYALNFSTDKSEESIDLIENKYTEGFREALNEDLNTSKAVGIIHQMLSDQEIETKEKIRSLVFFDNTLGLDIKKLVTPIGELVEKYIQERNIARQEKRWEESDRIRKLIEEMGHEVFDTAEGTKILKKL